MSDRWDDLKVARGGSVVMTVLLLARTCRSWSGRAYPLYPGTSDLNLFRYGKGIIHLESEISDGAFDLSVAEQKLHGRQIASALVDQRRFLSAGANGCRKASKIPHRWFGYA